MNFGIGLGITYPNGITYLNGISPASLFAANEQGVWYDPSDMSTMYQDAAGTTPVTAVGQPVGLMLDKSKGLTLGPELVTNGDFSNGATGWSLSNGAVISDGSLTLTTSSSTDANATQEISTVNGRRYAVTVSKVSSTTSGTGIQSSAVLTVANGGGIYDLGALPAGNYTFYPSVGFTGITVFGLVIYNNTPTTTVFDNFSVRELPGNHATQATAPARPVQATGIDLDGVDDSMAQSAGGGSTTAFMLCAAVKPEGGAASARTIWSDAGTNTGYIVRLNASNQLEMAAGNGTAYTTIATTATVDVGTAYVVTVWDDGTNLNVQVNNGTVASVARPTVSAGTATATLGKDNGAATGFFNGTLISVVQVKNDGGTADERTAAKAYAAGKGGVTL